MRPDIPIQEIVWKLEERLEEVVREFWPSAVKEGGVLYPCPGKSDLGSFQVFLTSNGKRERGRWVRYSQNRGGNVLNLVAYALSGEIDHKPASYGPAVLWAKQWLGIERPETPAERRKREERAEKGRLKREKEAEAERQRMLRHVAEIRKAAAPFDRFDATNPVVRYLTGEPKYVAGRNVGNRGFDLTIPSWCAPIRFAPALRHWKARVTGPAMVADVVKEGRLVAVHCTWLDPDGVGKAKKLPKAASSKLMRGDVEGGFVPISYGSTGLPLSAAVAASLSSPLIIGEGIESSVALASAIEEARVVAALSQSNIANLAWLVASAGVSSTTIAQENDLKPAALRERERVLSVLEATGKPIHTMRSHVGSDFADLY